MNIRWTHFEQLDPVARVQVEARLRALGEENQQLIDVHLMGYESPHHRHGDAEVRIVGRSGRKQIVVRRRRDELGIALGEALDALERTVREHSDRRQRTLRRSPTLSQYREFVSQDVGAPSAQAT